MSDKSDFAVPSISPLLRSALEKTFDEPSTVGTNRQETIGKP